MDYQCSKPLGEILDRLPNAGVINLSALASEVANLCEGEKEVAKCMLSHCEGQMLLATLIRHLHDCIVHDSAVRDVLTVGHLAKLMCRMDILKSTSNPAIVGLPNVLFDKRSQQERQDFFAKPGILPVNGELLEIGLVKEMLRREASCGKR